MTAMRPFFMSPFATLLLATSLTACGNDGLSPGEGIPGTLQLRFSQSATAAAVAPAVNVAHGNVVRSDINDAGITISEISALPVDGDEHDEAAWVRVPLSTWLGLDPLDLPTSLDNAHALQAAALPPGTYKNLRLHLADASIRFRNAVEVGQRTWEAGTIYPFRISGADGTKIEIPTASFVVLSDATSEVDLVLQVDATVQTIAATQSHILMSPVLVANNRR